jgi:integrase
MKTKTEDAANIVLKFLTEVPMSTTTVKYYRSCYRTITRFCQSNGIEDFSYKDMEVFNKYQMQRLENGEVKLIYVLTLRKAALMLADQLNGKKLVWERHNYKRKQLSNNYENALSEFELYLTKSLSSGSIRLIIQMTRQFLNYLENIEVYNFNKLTFENVKRFIINVSPRHKNNMINLTWPIKKFLLFLNDNGLVKIDAEKVLINTIPRRSKALPCFTTAEADSILNSVNTSTALGKRDYAILKLAMGTGLRGEDIFRLKLSDIDWRKNEICVIQSKTGEHVILPLMPDVGNAVADYILNARPKTENTFIFIRHRKPHRWLGDGPNGALIMKRYQKSSGIIHEAGDGKTFHAFRRTVGTRLIKAEVPLPMTAQILGHKKIESTKRYISLNDDMLRVCCLDISDYSTKKEGLI